MEKIQVNMEAAENKETKCNVFNADSFEFVGVVQGGNFNGFNLYTWQHGGKDAAIIGFICIFGRMVQVGYFENYL